MANSVKIMERKINAISFTVFFVKVFTVIFFIYAFFAFLFWFLNCFEVEWLYLFNWLFIIPYKIVNVFYKPQGVSADFTLAIIGGISFIFGLIFQNSINFLYEKMLDMEDEKERIKAVIKKNRSLKFARMSLASLTEDKKSAVIKEAQLVFLITARVEKIKKQKEDSDLPLQAVNEYKTLVYKEILKKITAIRPIQKGYFRKNLFMLFKDFKITDNLIYILKPALEEITQEYTREDVSVTFSVILSSIFDVNNLEKELDSMDTIFLLNIDDLIIVTNKFKLNYENNTTFKYALKLKGEYNLSKNLTISNNQTIYSLIDKKAQKEKEGLKGKNKQGENSNENENNKNGS